MNITMTIEGTSEGVDKLTKFAERIMQTRELAAAVGDVLADSMKQNIIESRTPWGEPYPPLKQFEQQAFRKGLSPGVSAHAGPDRRGISTRVADIPLRRTDTLLDSIHYGLEREMPGFAEVSIGHHVRYGDWQNFGTDTIPARTFMGIRPENLETEAAMTHKFALDALIHPQTRMNVYD